MKRGFLIRERCVPALPSKIMPLFRLFPQIFTALLLLFAMSCSSTPKDMQPTQEVTKTASEYAVFGNKFYREGRFREAEEMYLYSLQYYKRIDNRIGILNSYNSLGKTYLAGGTPEKADKMFSAALVISDAIERGGVVPRKEIIPLRGETLNNLGEAALRRGDYATAKEYFNKGIELLGSKDYKEGLAVLLHNRGSVLFREGKYQEAREDFNSSLEINSDFAAYTETASNYYMLSRLDSKEGNTAAARSNALKALEIDKITENSIGIAQDLIALGHIEAQEDKLEESGDYYIRAYRVYTSLNLDNGAQKVVEYLKRIGADSRIAEEEPKFNLPTEGMEDTVGTENTEGQNTLPPIPSEHFENEFENKTEQK
ncbi:MAG: tetratricopeptide repeat protein [Spirochaetaceae bacterium]